MGTLSQHYPMFIPKGSSYTYCVRIRYDFLNKLLEAKFYSARAADEMRFNEAVLEMGNLY